MTPWWRDVWRASLVLWLVALILHGLYWLTTKALETASQLGWL